MYFLSEKIDMVLTFFSSMPYISPLFVVVILSFFIRGLLTPFQFIGWRNRRIKESLKDEVKFIKEQHESKEKKVEKKLTKQRIKQLYQEHKLVPLGYRMIFMAIQIFIMIQAIHALYHVTTQKSGLWFNLGQTDPYYILPGVLLVLASFNSYVVSVDKSLATRILLSIINLIMFIFSLFIPTAVVIYWLVGTIHSMIFTMVFERKYTEQFLNLKLPDVLFQNRIIRAK